MKKSLLALVVASVAASSVQAATVYQKDGTELKVDGRVQAVIYNGGNGKAGENDSTLENSARFGIGGSTKVSSITLLGYSQWDMADGSSKKGDKITARDQFVGADFGQYGKLTAGRYKSNQAWVTGTTDVFDDYGCNAQAANDERNSGRIDYAIKANGFEAKLGTVLAVDSYKLEHGITEEKSVAIDHGFSGAFGYTFDKVGFGPLSLRAGYELLKAQEDLKSGISMSVIDDVNTFNLGASWGATSEGVYLGAAYLDRTIDFKNKYIVNNTQIDSSSLKDFKAKGFEFVVGYTFANGVALRAGYNQIRYNDGDNKASEKAIPLYVNYKVTPNFNVWTEARFDVSSKDDLKKLKAMHANTSYSTDKTVASVGARYTF